MRNRKLQNQKLDAIGRKLIAGGRLRDAEIDQIASKADLFDGVRARIRSGEGPAETRRAGFSFGKYRLVVGSTLTVLFCVGVFGFYVQQRPAVISRGTNVPEQTPDQARSGITPQVIVKGFTSGRVYEIPVEVEQLPVVERTVYRPQPDQFRPTVQRTNMQSVPDAEFYPVTYNGDAGEKARGGRVIRVDVPRSTLFAMGIDLPLENESGTVKADLLVGPDGVTHAIRIVN
ncbi:MAG TPA: hypothetical protein VK612_12355 [Pyrinomonadaceae bacterium]|nr:hypothetical protein [Pyrinomonadaceae bacterium]